jgi:hypothetical protein
MTPHRTLLLPLLLAGCNAAPLDYTPVDGIKPGPGMFSGAEGGFTLRAGGAKEAAPASAEEYREFQEWREWRRAREEAGKK